MEGTEDLRVIVKAMKALAAVRIRQFSQAAGAVRGYQGTVEAGLQAALRNRQREQAYVRANGADGRWLVSVVVGSDQGLVGQFNARVVRHAREAVERLAPQPEVEMTAAVGARAAGALEAGGVPAGAKFSVPGSIVGIADTVRDILVTLESWRREHGVDRVLLFYNEATSGASYEPRTEGLLPIDEDWLRNLARKPWQSRAIPFARLAWPPLFGALVREHLFAAVFRAVAASLAAENASRLAAMEAAERRIEERLDLLRQRLHRERQQAITEELLDLVAGFEALESG